MLLLVLVLQVYLQVTNNISIIITFLIDIIFITIARTNFIIFIMLINNIE